MIKKIFRLKENEVKKVLWNTKPFFSYWIVLNKKTNRLNHNRFAIIISSKSVKKNVDRVFFRRRFYNFVRNLEYISIDNKFSDFVFIVKKQNKLDRKEKSTINSFDKDIKFLISKFLQK